MIKTLVGWVTIRTILIVRIPINQSLPVVRHEAVPEVSKGKVYIYIYINQKKNVPVEIVCDMFEHFALRATLFAELVLD